MPAVAGAGPLTGGLTEEETGHAAPPAIRDAISALVNLGYGRPQATAAVAAAQQALGEDSEAHALIRRGLKELANA
jgi:Holliday junction DNA helicase RuvA